MPKKNQIARERKREKEKEREREREREREKERKGEACIRESKLPMLALSEGTL